MMMLMMMMKYWWIPYQPAADKATPAGVNSAELAAAMKTAD